MDAKIHQDLGACAIVPEIRGEAQLHVGFHSVIALVLQGIGLDFVGKPYAAAFLAHVHKAAATFLFNLAQCCTKLAPAVAAQGS